MYPPIKDPITNKYINISITKKYPSFPPHLEKYPPGNKSLLNDVHDPNSAEDDHDDSKDNSRNKKEDSVNDLKVTNNEDNDEEYKDDNYLAINSDESVINKTE